VEVPRAKYALLAPVRQEVVMIEQTAYATWVKLDRMERYVLPVLLGNTRILRALPRAQRAKTLFFQMAKSSLRQLEAQTNLIAQQ